MNQALSQLNVFHPASSAAPTPDITDMWCLDRIGIHDSPKVTADDLALKHFQDHVRIVDGRYEVAWPWKATPPDLPTNYGLAIGRLSSLCRRLSADPDLLHKYDTVMKSQTDLGVIEEVTEQSTIGPVQHYLPHQPVVTPSKATTKLRIVYDASAKSSKRSNSLNDSMYRGPIRLPNLCGMLLRFRCHDVVMLADIEKAFLQLSIRPEDRDVTRFLWLKDVARPTPTEDNLAVYCFCRMPFGVIASPFLLEATVRHHLRSHPSALSTMIADNIYVDNIIIGIDDHTDSTTVYRQSKDLFAKASMNLREWTSNSAEVRAALPQQDRVQARHVKVLGLSWDTQADQLTIPSSKTLRVPSTPDSPVTKRIVLCGLSSLYDPLGLVLPITLRARLLLRQIWQSQLDWDSPLPESLAEQWLEISAMMSDVSSLAIPRLYGPVTAAVDIQLHVFTDASMDAYAAAAFLRVTTAGKHYASLIFSKLRLAPTSKSQSGESLSIPRLELMGVVIGARLAVFLLEQLHVRISSTTLWTDSKCVLHWLASTRDLALFVQNRIAELRSHKSLAYRYVPTSANPADLATRPRSVQDLAKDALWWHGPPWLQGPDSHWPLRESLHLTPETLQQIAAELRGSNVLHSVTLAAADTTPPMPAADVLTVLVDRTSRLERLVHIVFYCCRFIQLKLWASLTSERRTALHKSHPLLRTLLQALIKTPALTATTRRLILCLLVRSAQQQCFTSVFNSIAKGTRCPLQQQLGLTIDTFVIIRCHGRVKPASDTADAPQALLPPGHRLTHLIVMDVHCRLLHVGTTHTLAQLRLYFLLPRGRETVRAIIRRCVTCRRHEGSPFKLPLPPPLPKERVARAAPFEFVGLDYFGPLLTRSSDGVVTKVWVYLYTCFAVRAVHLECVLDMSTDHFIASLRRFIARRGVPRLLYSDNASQFKLASSVLDEAWSDATSDPMVQDYLTNHDIVWKFTTALAPWQGGLYERMVGLVKRSLRKSIGRQLLTVNQLTTVSTSLVLLLNPDDGSWPKF
ncbi:uncharacterized protein LOC135810660 [Sycon ciliatum]|uniref:uncharacterized protein LOC135810660 n=1 Tax=Sycon ciliatum TaxID=27933 RepID=UPI0031F6898C